MGTGPGPGFNRKMPTKTIGFILSMLILPLTVLVCKREPRICRTLPASIVWEKDQAVIHPRTGSMNVWEGWAVRGDHFEASKNRSRFVFWRNKGGSSRFRITYSLRSKNGILMCNEKQVALPPADGLFKDLLRLQTEERIQFSRDFEARRGIRSRSARSRSAMARTMITISGKANNLVEYFPPGEGSLLFSGQGSLIIEKAETREGGIESESRRLEPSRSRKGSPL